MANIASPEARAIPYRSRVSWGAIFAGSFVSLSLFVLLGTLVAAIGLSGGGQVGSGTLIWEGVVGLFSLLVGGWVTGQWIEGESKVEAVLNGLVLWGLLFVFTVFVGLSAVRAGIGLAMGVSNVATGLVGKALSPADLTRLRSHLGLNDVQFSRLQQELQAKVGSAGPVNLGPTAWWSFVGVVLSMLVTEIGSLMGSASSVVPPRQGVIPRDTARAA